MNVRKRAARAAAAVVAFSVVAQPSLPLVAAGQAPAPSKPAAQPAPTATSPPTTAPTGSKPAQAATASAAAAPIDGGWPRVYNLPSGGNFLVYQPQIASWDKQAHMVAFSAVSLRTKGAEKPSFGTVKLEADTKVSLSERLVQFQPLKIAEASFATLPKEQVREIVAEIDRAIPDDERVIALDRVLANLNKSQIVPKVVEGLKADPPKIFFSKTPAVIVNIDSDPIWSPIKDNDLKYAVNTNWDLFQHTPTNTYYLRNNDTWLKASDVNGKWSPAGTLPASFSKLPAEDNWTDVKANLPGKAVKASAVPKVLVSTQPAELILLRGEPNYLLVSGTTLLWVSNSDSDVFRLGKTGPIYYLVAGRWFSAPDFTGPWTFATQNLPPDFKKIPLEHERSRVLASVPGTDQAAEAVLLAQIPQTARVSKKQLKAPDVAFQGDPKFAPIEKTTVRARREHRQGRLQGRRFVLHVLPGRVVRLEERVGSLGSGQLGAAANLRDSGELAGQSRHVCDGGGQRRRVGHVRGGGRLYGNDDRLGLRGLGLGLVLSAILRVWRLLSILLPVLPDLRVLRLVQPLYRRVWPQRRGIRTVRRCGYWRALQPSHWHLRSRCRRLRSLWRSGRGASLQPADWHVRRDTTGIERLRKLGIDLRSAG